MYSNDEKETTCVYDYTLNEWNVYSCVPKHLTRLRKVAGEPYWKEETEGRDGAKRLLAAKWRLKGNQIRFAVGAISNKTEEQRQAASDRMKRIHEKRNQPTGENIL